MKRQIVLDHSAGIKRLKVLTNRLVNSQIIGGYRSVFKGRGLEFTDYRHYTPNDDASMIDWKASVRSKELLIKNFSEERNLNVFFLIDFSSSMLHTSEEKLKIEYAIELVATLSYAVLQAGDSVSYAFFNDKIILHEPPNQGLKQYYKLARILIDTKYYGGNYNLEAALKFSLAFLKEFSIVIIVSDFIGLKGDWKRYLKMVGKKYDLIGVMVRDRIDKELPDYDGKVILGDVYSNNRIIADISSIKAPYANYVKANEREIKGAFVDAKGDFLELRTDQQFITPLADLFMSRTKRIR